jgi:hypothetical protein
MTLKMYRFFRQGASYSLLAVGVVLLLQGCSSTPNPVTVPIESTRLAHGDCHRLPKSSAPSVVYRCTSDVGPLFVATMKDCSIPEKFSFQATTRQLLVGLVGAKVARQTSVPVGDMKMLQSVITGTVDADPVVLSTFTFRQENCVTDIVLWQSAGTQATVPEERLSAFAESSRKLATSLLNDELLVHDVTPSQS